MSGVEVDLNASGQSYLALTPGTSIGLNIVCAGAAFSIFAFTAAPGAFWLDSSELSLASAAFGVAHPPGQPAYVLTTKLGQLIPGGSLGFRSNLMAAAWGAISAACVCDLTWCLSEFLVGPRPGAARFRGIVSIACGLAAALSGAIWAQAVRAEVYSLQAAVGLLLSCLSVRAIGQSGLDRRHGLLAAALLGVGAANHHYLALLCVPGLLFAWGYSELRSRHIRGSAWTRLTMMAGLSGLGLVTYTALPLFSLAAPPLDWTHPTTFARFVDTLLARAFHASVTGPGLPSAPGGDPEAQFFWAMEHLSPFAVLAAALGFIGLIPGRIAIAGFAALTIAGNQLSTGMMDFDPQNLDAWGYLSLSVGWYAALCGAFVTHLTVSAWRLADDTAFTSTNASVFSPSEPMPALSASAPTSRNIRWSTPLARGIAITGTLAILAWPCFQATQWFKRVDLRDFHALDLAVDAQWAQLPPGALVGSRYFSNSFAQQYAQATEGRRPDLTIFNQTLQTQLYGGQVYIEQLIRTYPKWAAEFASAVSPDRSEVAWPTQAIAEASFRRPVWMEAELDPPLPADWLKPHGLVVAAGSPAKSLDSAGTAPEPCGSENRTCELLRGSPDRLHLDCPETKSWLLWQHTQLAGLYTRRGELVCADSHLYCAQKLAPRSPQLARLHAIIRGLAKLGGEDRKRALRQIQDQSLQDAIGL